MSYRVVVMAPAEDRPGELWSVYCFEASLGLENESQKVCKTC